MTQDITISVILHMILRHIKLIVWFVLVGAVVMFCYSYFFVVPTYSSSGIILIQNTDDYLTQTTNPNSSTTTKKIYVSDISSSATLAQHCSILFSIDAGMKKILNENQLNIESIEETNFLKFTVISTNKSSVKAIAQEAMQEAVKVYIDTYNGAGKISIKSEASSPVYASTTNIKNNTLVGASIGLLIALILAMILELIDSSIKSDDDLYKKYGIPVFAEIIDLESAKREANKK